jgi:hypothetical protein
MIYSYWAMLPDADGDEFPLARFMHAESGVVIVFAYAITALLVVWGWKKRDERKRAKGQTGI